MAKVVGVGFKDVGKIYWFNPNFLKLPLKTAVIVETIRGLEMGWVVNEVTEVSDTELEHELKDVLRIATEKDISNYLENETKAVDAFERAKAVIKRHQLEMKTVGCEYTLDGSKLLIYYNAEGRIDFRELVKDLASEFRVRIELRQIGPREGAKMLGGIGACGREICCKKHLREFDLVTMKMAKDQGMALAANKIAGLCGKLMCCIAYESQHYADARKRVPQVGDIVQTPTCSGCKVISVDYLREIVRTEAKDKEGYEEWPAEKTTKLKSNKPDISEETENGIDS